MVDEFAEEEGVEIGVVVDGRVGGGAGGELDGGATSGDLRFLDEFFGVGAGEVLVEDTGEGLLGRGLGEFAGAWEGGGWVGLLRPFCQVCAAFGDVEGFKFVHFFPKKLGMGRGSRGGGGKAL